MASSTLVQLLTRFFLILAVVAVASSSARPHFGEVNQDVEGQEEYDEPSSFSSSASAGIQLYPDYGITGDDYYYPDEGYQHNQLDNTGKDVQITPEDIEIYKRMSNPRYQAGIYRRNGFDKKLRIKPNGMSSYRCLVNPVTCFK